MTVAEFTPGLDGWLDGFLVDRRAQNLAEGTVSFYQVKLGVFLTFCKAQAISRIEQITPGALRRYILWLEEKGHNPGGVHGCYRTVKTFLLWYELEAEPEGWKNPIRRVKAPRLAIEPPAAISLDDFSKLVRTCDTSLVGSRDKAILYALLDTGAQASELCAMDVNDLNPVTGNILIRQGKGRNPRTVYLGHWSRKAVRAYLALCNDKCPALWITDEGDRLHYWGLRQLLRRRSRQAGIKTPQIHAFRRAFALNCLRAGMDIFTLQILMGHANLQVLRRYLAQTDEDTRKAHAVASPADSCPITVQLLSAIRSRALQATPFRLPGASSSTG